MRRLKTYLAVMVLIVITITGCTGLQPRAISPVEQEQIENVARAYLVRNTNIPEYEVEIEEVSGDWARVTVEPAAIEGEEATLYLQNQIGAGDAPTARPKVQPGNSARVETTTGWAVILGPQASFSEDELNEAGVPQDIRP